jgi:hypothetical protein
LSITPSLFCGKYKNTPIWGIFVFTVRGILKIVRTPVVKQSLLRGTAHFAAAGGEENPRESANWRTKRRSHADDNFKFFFGGYYS